MAWRWAGQPTSSCSTATSLQPRSPSSYPRFAPSRTGAKASAARPRSCSGRPDAKERRVHSARNHANWGGKPMRPEHQLPAAPAPASAGRGDRTGAGGAGRPALAFLPAAMGVLAAFTAGGPASAADYYLPIVMPITGFLSVEGGSQRNGSVMALESGTGGFKVDHPVYDTGTSATGAAQALDKALSSGDAIASSTSVFCTEMVAMKPIAEEYKVPLLTISGLSVLTESGSRYIFRFLPNDREIKVAQARYVVEVLKKTRPALVGDTTAYGQGGYKLLQEDFAKLGVKPVYQDSSLAPDTKDMSPLLAKIKESGADV